MRSSAVRAHAFACAIAEPSMRGRDERQLDADAHVQRERVPARRRPHDVDVHALDANDGAAGRMHSRLRAGFDCVPDSRPQRVHGQRPVHQRLRDLLHRNQGLPGGLQRYEHELPDGLRGGDAEHLRKLVAVGALFARHGVLCAPAWLYVACGTGNRARVPSAVREHGADGAVGARCDVSGVGLAADGAMPVVLVVQPAEYHDRLSRWRQSAGRNLGPWRHLPGLELQRRHVSAAAGAAVVPLLQRRAAYGVHDYGRSTSNGRAACARWRECHRQ